jgi:hypothetical protein
MFFQNAVGAWGTLHLQEDPCRFKAPQVLFTKYKASCKYNKNFFFKCRDLNLPQTYW